MLKAFLNKGISEDPNLVEFYKKIVEILVSN